MKRLLLSALCLIAASSAWAQDSFVHEQSDGYVWPTDPLVLEKLDQKRIIMIAAIYERN
jgi:hypothetical protein